MRFLVRQSSAPSGSRNASLDSGCVPVPGEGLKDGNRTPREGQADPRRRRRADDPHAARGHAQRTRPPSPPKPQASKRRWKRRRTPTSTLRSSTPISRASPPRRLPMSSLPAARRSFLPRAMARCPSPIGPVDGDEAVPNGWAKANAAERVRVAVSQ
jgi:hypothetical protein